LPALVRQRLGSVPDFPVPGIDFKDITPVLADGEAFASLIAELRDRARALGEIDGVLAIESRGFVFGAPLASELRSGLILVRKPGKLPGENDSFAYTCEYRSGMLEVRPGAIQPGKRYLVVDDLLATGGTARATADYIGARGGSVAGFCFFLELTFLGGREVLRDAPVISLVAD
jgi:adenine phosphoribosyltransferase